MVLEHLLGHSAPSSALTLKPHLWSALLVVGLVSACATTVAQNNAEGSPSPSHPPPDNATMDHYAFMVECLADQGIAAEYDPATGGLNLHFEGIDQEIVNQTVIDCRERDGQPIDVLDAGYLTDYYRSWWSCTNAWSTTDCLRRNW